MGIKTTEWTLQATNNGISHGKTWRWLRKGNLKGESEPLLIVAQNNTIRTSYITARIDKTKQNRLCRVCG